MSNYITTPNKIINKNDYFLEIPLTIKCEKIKNETNKTNECLIKIRKLIKDLEKKRKKLYNNNV